MIFPTTALPPHVPCGIFSLNSPAFRPFIPGVSVRKGLKAPSNGVCTFDGATHDGNMHETELATGYADYLVSNPIDLLGKLPSDSIYFSFQVQRGGSGDHPEGTDSLVLYFDSTGTYDYVRVWSMTGAVSGDTAFMQVVLPLTDLNFLHANFRFRFENFGSLNGEFDVWHIDYVWIAANRSFNGSLPVDISPLMVKRSPVFPYTSIPYDHFIQSTWGSLPTVQFTNAGNTAASSTGTSAIFDPVGGNTLNSPSTIGYPSLSLPAAGTFEAQAASGFAEQATAFAGFGAINMRTHTSTGTDAHKENDSLTFWIGVDSVLALDDGVSDGAYGLTAGRSFCQEFNIPSPDTLTAVWVYFTPYLYVASTGLSTSLEGKNFRLAVWDTLAVDSFLLQTSQGMNVTYDSTLNAFHRFVLNNPLEVKSQFWVGMRQVDQMPLGIGFDRNLHVSPMYYEANNGDFVLSTNLGSLMIRPEFARKRPLPAGTLAGTEHFLLWDLYPNPLDHTALHARIANGNGIRGAKLQVFDMRGTSVHEMEWPNGQANIELPRDVFQVPGLYLVKFEGLSKGNEIIREVKRVLVR
jgi:hypothetical protein